MSKWVTVDIVIYNAIQLLKLIENTKELNLIGKFF